MKQPVVLEIVTALVWRAEQRGPSKSSYTSSADKMPLSSDHFLSKWLLLALWGVICCLGAYIICMIFHEVLKLELSFLGFH